MAAGIYDDGFSFKMGYAKLKKPVFFLLIAAALVVILLALISLPKLFEQKPLELRLSKNEIKATEQADLFAKVVNTTGKDARNVILEIEAVDNRSIAISPSKMAIDIIESGGSRNPKFSVNPVGAVMPGSYVIKAKLRINDSVFSQEISLAVK